MAKNYGKQRSKMRGVAHAADRLIEGKSDETRSKNIATEIKADKSSVSEALAAVRDVALMLERMTVRA